MTVSPSMSVAREGPLTIVTLERPEALNALDFAAHLHLAEIFDAFAADPDNGRPSSQASEIGPSAPGRISRARPAAMIGGRRRGVSAVWPAASTSTSRSSPP